MSKPTAGIPNACWPEPDLLSGGQPGVDQLSALASQGFRTVINLRADGEFDAWDAEDEVSALGMAYHHLPVAGPQDVSVETARRLRAMLDLPDARPALVYCGSGNRVGALLALVAAERGLTPEQALDYGRRGGLAGLESYVRGLLSGG
jgi:uncharacterized protein (TIGR01244 family)